MKTIVSIDLWGTLIKASPTFKEAKYKLVEDFLNRSNKKEIENAFISTKHKFDYIIERTGWQPGVHELWKMLLSEMGINSLHSNWEIEQQHINNIHWKYCELALNHVPSLYDEDTKSILENLSSQYQLTLSSNTLFLPSRVMEQYLMILDIKKYFTHLHFSNRLGVSKPNPKMYGNSKYHIGDNIRTDYHGAKAVGIDSYLIRINNKTLTDAYNYIQDREESKVSKICSRCWGRNKVWDNGDITTCHM